MSSRHAMAQVCYHGLHKRDSESPFFLKALVICHCMLLTVPVCIAALSSPCRQTNWHRVVRCWMVIYFRNSSKYPVYASLRFLNHSQTSEEPFLRAACLLSATVL
eukprot:EG_transcript_28605